MPTPHAAIEVTVTNPPRGQGQQESLGFFAQSLKATTAWGSAPGTAELIYPNTGVQIYCGSLVVIQAGGHTFYGICRSDTLVDGSHGKLRTLSFVDTREFLTWDVVFGLFNRVDIRMVEGVRVRRFKHIYPADYKLQKESFTDDPLTAAEIIRALLGAPTVGSPWLAAGPVFHAHQETTPVYEVDCLSGKTLAAALQEVTDKCGLVFGLVPGTPYQLAWVRKGVGVMGVAPNDTENRRSGVALSGNPTRVCLVGDRNKYQVLNVPMVADWLPAWEAFPVVELLAHDLFLRASDPVSGKRLNALENDLEQYRGRQMAMARALEITVGEYVVLRTAVPLPTDGAVGGTAFADYRKVHHRSRLDMPAALYIRQLLFRAFRPDFTAIAGMTGTLRASDLTLTDTMLCRCTHDVATGTISALVNERAEGNGYAVVKGYRVGEDCFRTVQPPQFSLDYFASTRAVWQAIPFQIDDSGAGDRFIVFDEPVVVSDDLVADVNGLKVMRADFTLQVPPVQAALCFEGEKFLYWYGTGSRDAVENVGGLNGEYVLDAPAGKLTEITYGNGDTVVDQAVAIAESLGSRVYAYTDGGYTRYAATPATPLSWLVDRVTLEVGPNGVFETVDWTAERRRDNFEPSRELDRANRMEGLLPGQQELRDQAAAHRKLAGGFKQNPAFVRTLSDLLGGGIGVPVEHLTPTFLVGAGGPLPVGTPLWKKPTTSDGKNTVPVPPEGVTSAHTVFAGVTVRDGEDCAKPFRVQTQGVACVRVKGPVEVNTPVGWVQGYGYLEANATPSVGVAMQKITASDVQLVQVRLGSGGGGSGLPVWL